MEYPLIRTRDLEFLLWDWLHADTLFAHPDFSQLDRSMVDALLELSLRLAQDQFLPHYKEADRNEPSQDAEGNVHVYPAIGEALRQYADLGFFGAGFAESLGGMQLPTVFVTASLAQFMAANIATSAYVMLTIANARLIAKFGSDVQVETFARPQIAGTMFGTMCLSEPQAGSSLADVVTRASPDGEESLGRRYRLVGNKMWISGGDQDITPNIVHLVLAKIEDASGRLPAGSKGLSLFIVPKLLPDTGERNDIAVAGLNHKMGYRGTSNCLLNLGEGHFLPHGKTGAVGYLIGEEGQGLQQMFHMMNEARINVGLGAAALACRGYSHSLQYSRERIQGRLASAPKDGAASPVALIEHVDVRRMLLAQKTYSEGALALILYCAVLVDQTTDEDSAELLSLLTPVAKTWPSEFGLAANDLAIQIHGGYGYTRDFDVEQLYRDNRLNPIHEGTTGIQALDLLGRKLLRDDPRGLHVLAIRLRETCRQARKLRQLAQHANSLDACWDLLTATLSELRSDRRPANRLDNATSFLQAFGHIVVAWLWLDQSLVCLERDDQDDFLTGKLKACSFFFTHELPKAELWLKLVKSQNSVVTETNPEML